MDLLSHLFNRPAINQVEPTQVPKMLSQFPQPRCSLYPRRLYSTAILAVFDSDPSGDPARLYLSRYPRITLLQSPAHDLTDYWRFGGNLLTWLVIRLRSV